MRRIISIVLAISMVVTLLCVPTLATSVDDSGVYLKQQATNTCTLVASVMVMRRKAILDGNENWATITEASAKPQMWSDGIKWTASYSDASKGLNMTMTKYAISGDVSNTLKSYLSNHPEGVMYYVFKRGGFSHAVTLTSVDNNGTFYCIDPATGTYSSLASSTLNNSAHVGGSTQDDIFKSNSNHWVWVLTSSSNTKTNPKPSTPSLSSVTSSGTSSIVVKWGKVSDATSYKVYRSVGTESNYQMIKSGVTGTSYTDSGLTAGTRYYYKVCATNTGGDSGLSGSKNTYTLCSKPTINSVYSGAKNNIVYWDSVQGASSYVLQWSTDGLKTYTEKEIKGATQYSISVNSNDYGKKFSYRLYAKNSAGRSVASSVFEKWSYLDYTGFETSAEYDANTDSIVISWNDVKGAASYDIYYQKVDSYIDSRKDKKIGSVKAGSGNKYMFTQLEVPAKYAFLVYPVSADGDYHYGITYNTVYLGGIIDSLYADQGADQIYIEWESYNSKEIFARDLYNYELVLTEQESGKEVERTIVNGNPYVYSDGEYTHEQESYIFYNLKSNMNYNLTITPVNANTGARLASADWWTLSTEKAAADGLYIEGTVERKANFSWNQFSTEPNGFVNYHLVVSADGEEIVSIYTKDSSYVSDKLLPKNYDFVLYTVYDDGSEVAGSRGSWYNFNYPKLDAPEPLEIELNSDGNEMISWGKVNGAVGYELILSDEESGDTIVEESLGKDTVNYEIDSNLLVSGKWYYVTLYPVAAEGSKGKFAYSTFDYVSYINITQLESTDEEIMLSWEALPDYSEYYDVYYRENNADDVWKLNTAWQLTHSISGLNADTEYQIYVAVRKSYYETIAKSPVLTIRTKSSEGIIITSQPEDYYYVTTQGGNAQFNVEAVGKNLEYQWKHQNGWYNWDRVENGTSQTLTISNPTNGPHKKYKCVLSDSDGHCLTTEIVSLYYSSLNTQIEYLIVDGDYATGISGSRIKDGNIIKAPIGKNITVSANHNTSEAPKETYLLCSPKDDEQWAVYDEVEKSFYHDGYMGYMWTDFTFPVTDIVKDLKFKVGAVDEYGNISYSTEFFVQTKEMDTQILGYTTSLNGNIGFNIYLQINDEVASDEKSSFHLTGRDEYAMLSVKDAEKVIRDKKEYYRFSCGMPAKNMTDWMQFEFYEGTGMSTKEYTYSVKQYAEYIISHPEKYSEEAINMEKAMLNYGGYAQIYFDYYTNDLANASIDNSLPDVKISDNYNYKLTGNCSGLNYNGSSLILEENTVIRHYFSVNGDINNYVFKCGDETLTPVASDSQYYVDITGIPASDLDKMYTLKVSNKKNPVVGANGENGNAIALSYSAYTNIKAILEGDYEDSAKDVMKALYVFGEAAKAYFKTV